MCTASTGVTYSGLLPAIDSPDIKEISPQLRLPSKLGAGWGRSLACFAQEPQFERDHERCSKLDSLSWDDDLLHKERICESFYPYIFGHSPKEHAMLKLQERLDKREDDRDERMRKREDARDADQKQNHKELLDQVRKNHWRELAVIGVGVLVFTIVAALIESGLWTPVGFERKADQVVIVTPVPIPPTPSPTPPTLDTESDSPQATP